MKYYLLTFNQDWADEHDVPALACFTETQYNEWLQKRQWKDEKDEDEKYSKIFAYLGNSGDEFAEKFEDLNCMKDFVDDGIVEVFEVTKEFYDLFNIAKLDELSLCSIFEL